MWTFEGERQKFYMYCWLRTTSLVEVTSSCTVDHYSVSRVGLEYL